MMIEIDIQTSDASSQKRIAQFEQAVEILSDLLTEQLVREAQRNAPTGTRMRIGRDRIGQTWRVFARDKAAQPAIEAAIRDFDWHRVLRDLMNKVK